MRWSLGLVVALVLLALPSRATVVGCTPISKGDVVLNHCVNHDYYPRSRDFELRHAVAGLARLRQRLLRAGAIEARPILIELPAFDVGDGLSIARAARCARDMGDDERSAPPLGSCYRIHVVGVTPSYPALRTLVTALGTLSPERSERRVADLGALEREVQGRKHAGIQLKPARFAAPAGGWALEPVWRDGALEPVLTRRGHPVRALPPLTGYLAATPIWSDDGRRVLYASLDELNVHDTRAATTTTITLEQWLPSKPHEVRAAFDGTGERIVVAADTNLLSDYRVWVFSSDGARAVRAPDSLASPGWAVALAQGAPPIWARNQIDDVARLLP